MRSITSNFKILSQYPGIAQCVAVSMTGPPVVKIIVNELTADSSTTIRMSGNVPTTAPLAAPKVRVILSLVSGYFEDLSRDFLGRIASP